jgi:prevent-host-death family protein
MTTCSHKEPTMRSIQVRDAKARFSALIAAAERGQPTLITRHGRPAAIVAPIADAQRLYPPESFVDVLLSFPGGIEFERDPSPLREAKL